MTEGQNASEAGGESRVAKQKTTDDWGAGKFIEILAHKEEYGGWSQDEIELKKGETYTIRLLAIDVAHSFKTEDLNIILTFIPGHPKEVVINPTQIGTFEFRCPIYCSELHSSMHGTITVV
ncbi:MAG: cupredoxin domain-containing protein [Thermoplasmata archaeon]